MGPRRYTGNITMSKEAGFLYKIWPRLSYSEIASFFLIILFYRANKLLMMRNKTYFRIVKIFAALIGYGCKGG